MALPPPGSAPPWRPLELALRDHMDGARGGVIRVLTETMESDRLPVRHFFRTARTFPPVEAAALELCRGRVLDVGAGAGAHALHLQRMGLEVTALDIAPGVVDILRARGVRDARRGEFLRHRGGPYDTLLFLMNGIGLAGTLAALDHVLAHARTLLAPGGQILADSCDLRANPDAELQADLARRAAEGRYFGEVLFYMEYADVRGRPFPWVYLDARRFAEHARRAGWRFRVITTTEHGEYLARLTAA